MTDQIITDEKALEDIMWRATSGCHFECTFLWGSPYIQQVVEEDVPNLLTTVHALQARCEKLEERVVQLEAEIARMSSATETLKRMPVIHDPVIHEAMDALFEDD